LKSVGLWDVTCAETEDTMPRRRMRNVTLNFIALTPSLKKTGRESSPSPYA
jgi:hypothetical protein